jgi:hypothetical protein
VTREFDADVFDSRQVSVQLPGLGTAVFVEPLADVHAVTLNGDLHRISSNSMRDSHGACGAN